MSSVSRIQLEEWLKTIEIKPQEKVLDIGGSQNPITDRIYNKDYFQEYKILDLKTPHTTKQKPDIIGNIQDYFLEIGELFDIAFCIEVMEYVYDPVQVFENISKFLKKDGILYISFHSLYGLHNPKGEDCLRYSKNAIYKLAEATGFEIEDIQTKELDQVGKNLYYQFCKSQGMRLDYQDEQTYDQGYLVKMKKI